MAKKKDSLRSEEKGKAPREIAGSHAAPRMSESDSSSVVPDDTVSSVDLPTEDALPVGEDLVLEVLQDLARLVIETHRSDPHRFGRKR